MPCSAPQADAAPNPETAGDKGADLAAAQAGGTAAAADGGAAAAADGDGEPPLKQQRRGDDGADVHSAGAAQPPASCAVPPMQGGQASGLLAGQRHLGLG